VVSAKTVPAQGIVFFNHMAIKSITFPFSFSMASYSIRSSTIRLGIFISTLVIAAILTVQLIWLDKIYRNEQKEFDQSLIIAIKGVYEDIDIASYNSSHLNELIESPEPHLYLARIRSTVNKDSLVSYLQNKLEDFEIFTDCYLGVYNAAEEKYIYTTILKSAGTRAKHDLNIPLMPRNYDHIALYFPNRRRYILGKMDYWIISSAILLVVLILFGAGLYYFYRQKFITETQRDFIHNFTHEFKTPVSVISLAADVLKNPAITEKPEKLATYAGIVGYQAAYLQSQTEKLLNFAYTESHQLHFTKERVNINELVKEAVSNLEPLIQERKAVIELTLEEKDPFLSANKDYLTIVIINLLDNAVKYSKRPVITVVTKNADNKMSLSVIDNGIGIEKKQLKNVFKKFFRIHKEDTYVSKGFGLGLSFVRKIVAGHGGKIRVESEPGKGSNFTIELPL
jgi:two-component system phosphate regulon sensor histidine kinase PhoR